jgi:hypothetical protein
VPFGSTAGINRLKLAAGLLVLLLTPVRANAQISTTNIRPLAFGNFIAGSGGTVIVAPDGGRRPEGNVVLLPSAASPAEFDLLDTTPANASNAVIVTLPSSGSLLRAGGADGMALTGFSSNLAPAARLTGGRIRLSVGAALVVAPDQPRGNYTGFISISIDSQ